MSEGRDTASDAISHGGQTDPAGVTSPGAHSGAGTGGSREADPNDSGAADREARFEGADGDEFSKLAKTLMRQGFEISRLRPPHELTASTRGLPAVMQELAKADGPISPGAIARATGVTDARIANALRVLEERGFVERRPCAADRRRVEVSLTAEGRADIRRHAAEGERFAAGFLRELGADDARDLVRILGNILEVMRRRREEGRDLNSCAEGSDSCWAQGSQAERLANGDMPKGE